MGVGLSTNGLLPYHIGVFLKISHDATKELLTRYTHTDLKIC